MLRIRAVLAASLIGPLLGGGPAWAATESPLPLEAALQQAASRHPELLAQQRQLPIAESELIRAGYWLPENPVLQASVGRGGDADLGVSLSQRLDIAGQRLLRLDVAGLGVDRVKAEIARVRQTALAETKGAFFNLLYWQERLALAKAMVAVNGELDRIAQLRLKAEDIAPVDATLVRLAYETAQASQTEVESQLAVARTALNRLLGRPIMDAVTVAGVLPPTAAPPVATAALTEALAHRPDLQAIDLQRQRLEAELVLWQREAVPSPTLGLDYGRQSDSSLGWNSPVQFQSHSLALQVSLPIPVIDRRQPEQARTQAELQALEASRAALAATIAQDVTQAVTTWQLRRAPAATYAAMLPKLEANVALLRSAYREGQVDLQRVLLAQDQLVQTRTALLDVQRQLRQAEVDTEHALGRLDVPTEEMP